MTFYIFFIYGKIIHIIYHDKMDFYRVIIVTRNGKIVWKLRPNEPFYKLMLGTMLY